MGLDVIEANNHWGLRERNTALEGRLAPCNGEASAGMCPRGRRHRRPPSRFSPGLAPDPGPPSELGYQLRPDRDHPDKQRNRRQRRRFFRENLQHARLPMSEHNQNSVPFLFFGQGLAVSQSEK